MRVPVSSNHDDLRAPFLPGVGGSGSPYDGQGQCGTEHVDGCLCSRLG
jgi:hypothetical protein